MAEGSVNRTLRVLEVLCRFGRQNLSDLAERTDLTPPTALRFLRIMRDAGFATQGDDRMWRPTMTMFRLGCAVVDSDGWGAMVNDALRTASQDLHETVVYASYDDGHTVYVAMVEPRRDMRTHVTLGARYLAPVTITGRAMLAFQPDDEVNRVLAAHRDEGAKAADVKAVRAELATIREAGAASGSGAVWHGLWGAAVPVLGRDGHAIGAVGTTMPATRRPDDASAAITVLSRAAASLSIS